MARAVFKGTIVAESEATEIVEGNHYFPKDAVNMELLEPSDTKSSCPWKGVASYYTVAVDGDESVDAAWTYPEAKDAAKRIEGYVAFWRGVTVEP